MIAKLIIAAYIILTASALVILKLGAKTGAPVQFLDGKLHFNITALTVSGIILYGLSFITYTYLISKYDLGYIIPITTALVYVLIFVASFLIFNEMFTAIKIAGICLIVAGVILLNTHK